MAKSEQTQKSMFTTPYFWAIVAGVIIFLNGIIQLSGGNTPLGIASLIVGVVAVAFGLWKRKQEAG